MPRRSHISYCIWVIRIWCLNIIIGVCKLSNKFICHLSKKEERYEFQNLVSLHSNEPTGFLLTKKKPKNHVDETMYSSSPLVLSFSKWEHCYRTIGGSMDMKQSDEWSTALATFALYIMPSSFSVCVHNVKGGTLYWIIEVKPEKQV